MSKICQELAVSIGVTGHCTLSPDHLSRIQKQVDQTLALFETELNNPKQYWDGFEESPVLRIVSCLAQGADLIVADTGRNRNWNLQAVLPFPAESPPHRKSYETDAHWLNFKQSIAQAESVLELAADYPYSEIDWNTELAKNARQRAYQQAGLRMLDYCDILLAIWDGTPQERKGSTYDVIDTAIKLDMLVVWIHATKNVEPVFLYWKTPSIDPFEESPVTSSAIQENLRKIFQLPTAQEKNNKELVSFDEFYTKEKRDLVNKQNIFTRGYSQTWRWFFNKFVPSRIKVSSFSNDNQITPYYEDADRLSGTYANLFRSSALWGCLLGVLAITCAAIPAAFYTHGEASETGFSKGLPIICGLLELVCIAAIYFNHRYSRKGRWQEKMTFYRYLAEQLRHFEVLNRSGWVIPSLQVTLHYESGHSCEWLRWYLRNIVRRIGVPHVQLSKEGHLPSQKELLKIWVQGQSKYHENSHDRYERLEHRLHQIAFLFFVLAAFALLFHLGELSAERFVHHESAHESGHVQIELIESHSNHLLSQVLLFLTIVFPVWAMGLHALGNYLETRRSIDRSAAMIRFLNEQQDRINKAQTISQLDIISQETAHRMLQEVADWHIQYRMNKLAMA